MFESAARHLRYAFSGALFAFSATFIVAGIMNGDSAFSKVFKIPGWLSLLVFFVALSVLAALEGLQIALVKASDQHHAAFSLTHPHAANHLRYIALHNRLARFLMGRQVLVVLAVFLLSRLTNFSAMQNFPVVGGALPGFFKVLVEIELFGVVLVVILAQLFPQLVAEKFPIECLNIRVSKLSTKCALALEWTGIAHFSYVLRDVLDWWLERKRSRFDSSVDRASDLFPDWRDIINEPNDADGVIVETLGHLASSWADFESRHLASPHLISVEKGEAERDQEADARETATVDIELAAQWSRKRTQLPQSTGRRRSASLTRVTSFQSLDSLKIAASTPHGDTVETLPLFVDLQEEGIAAATEQSRLAATDPEQFHKFPLLIGSRAWASPGMISAAFESAGLETPAFLLPVDHPDHVPPHIAAAQLLVESSTRRETKTNVSSWIESSVGDAASV